MKIIIIIIGHRPLYNIYITLNATRTFPKYPYGFYLPNNIVVLLMFRIIIHYIRHNTRVKVYRKTGSVLFADTKLVLTPRHGYGGGQ